MKIAVVGGGISGLGAAVILTRDHEVHLFEAENRLGGHAHTVEISEGDQRVPMDTGFLVFNELNYPHLTAFFKFLRVKTVDSDMSLAVRLAGRDFEWAGTDLNSTFGQRRNLLRPSFYRMLREILRFHREAENLLGLARRHGWALRDLLREGGYAAEFADHYLLPIGAAIWSTPERGMLDYPAATFLTFFLNHKLLQVNDRPVWKTVLGGSVQYVNRARALLPHVHQNYEVLSVSGGTKGLRVKTRAGEDYFDRVVMATHAPVTARLLEGASEGERKVLSAFSVVANRAVLHRDPSSMPRRRRCWSAWNVLAGGHEKVSLTYHLNRLQPLATKLNYFLSLNPPAAHSDPLAEFTYDHPKFDQAAIRAQRELSGIQGERGIYYAGAWTRYGFHEDGLGSAVAVAALLGVKPPWEVK